MSTQTRERRPGGGAEPHLHDTDRVAPDADALTQDAVDQALTGRLAVAVVWVDVDGRIRRGLRLTIASAERFARRCEAAGRPCEVVLIHLVPVARRRLTADHVPGRHEVRRDEHGHLVPNSRPGR